MDGLPFLASDCHRQVWNTPDEAIPHKLYFEKNIGYQLSSTLRAMMTSMLLNSRQIKQKHIHL